MILVNIFYNSKRTIFPGIALLALFLLFSGGCGHKGPPLPPISKKSKPPLPPVVIQKGKKIEIQIENPFADRGRGEWRLELYRLGETTLPKFGTAKADYNSVNDSDVNVRTSRIEVESYFPKISKIKKNTERFEEFTSKARRILTIIPKSEEQFSSPAKVKYSDPEPLFEDRRLPKVYYYALRAEDGEGLIEGWSNVAAIVPIRIASAPALKLENQGERVIGISMEPTLSFDEGYLSSYKVNRGKCAPMQNDSSFVAVGKEIAFLPKDWLSKGLLGVFPLRKQADSDVEEIFTPPGNAEDLNYKTLNIEGVRITSAGRKVQGISQKLLTADEVKKLANASLKIRISARSPRPEEIIALCIMDDGRSGKLEQFEMELEQAWKKFEFDFGISKVATKLNIMLTHSERTLIQSVDINNVSVTIASISDSEPLSKEAKSEDFVEPGIKKEKDVAFEEGQELVKNSSFKSWSSFKFTDSAFRFGTEYCYYAVSLLDFEKMKYESDLGPPLRVLPVDIYPPLKPSGLYKLERLDALTLIWKPNTEPDLAGYNIYRRAGISRDFEKINSALVKGTQFVDKPPLVGQEYFYMITAVDQAKPPNESEPSDIVNFMSRPDIKPIFNKNEKK